MGTSFFDLLNATEVYVFWGNTMYNELDQCMIHDTIGYIMLRFQISQTIKMETLPDKWDR